MGALQISSEVLILGKRYWPGVGSYAFGLVFKNTFTGLVESLKFCGRAALCVASVASDALSTAGNGAGTSGTGLLRGALQQV